MEMGLPGIVGGIYRRIDIFAQIFQEKELALTDNTTKIRRKSQGENFYRSLAPAFCSLKTSCSSCLRGKNNLLTEHRILSVTFGVGAIEQFAGTTGTSPGHRNHR
jgi:hypothetical protein